MSVVSGDNSGGGGENKTKPGSVNGGLTIIAALLSMVGPFTIDTYLPSFPDIEIDFGVNRAVLSQSLGVYLAAVAITTLFWGPLSDRIGRRVVILTSMFLYIIASIGCAMADNIDAFLFMRVMQGLAVSGSFTASRAMIRDVHDAQSAHRAMSQVMLMFAIAPAIAPILGAWLHDMFGWRSVFWFLAIFGASLMVMVFFIGETLLREHRQSFKPTSVAAVYFRMFKNKHFMFLVVSLSSTFGGLFVYIAGAPTVIYDFLGLGSDGFAYMFIPMVGGVMMGSVISGRLTHKTSSSKIASIGFWVLTAAVTINILQAEFISPTMISVVGSLVAYAFGLALVMPAISVMALDCFPHNRGSAAAVQGFLQTLSIAAVSSLAVPLLSEKLIFFAGGQGMLLALSIALWFYVGKASRLSSVK
ncbi:MAG: multidrug effflux MFS transporter [Rhodospirillaceae bacterium]|nr:multidrug effflux MFS transporter [Rhodospirillaceae bacterium]